MHTWAGSWFEPRDRGPWGWATVAETTRRIGRLAWGLGHAWVKYFSI